MQMKVYNLEDEQQFADFTRGGAVKINVPGSSVQVDYDPMKRIGVIVSKNGASESIALGAYVYALNKLDE